MGHRLSIVPALAGLLLVSCQTINEELPAGPAAPSGVTAPAPTVVVVPVNLPSPAGPGPAATPTPTPGGGSTPAPAPTAAPPSSQGCSLPRSNGTGSCPRQSPTFLREVEAAIDEVIRTEPGLFNKNKTAGCGTCYEVHDWTRYTQRVAQAIQRNGICAIYDGEELAVKNTNSFNDQYDILTSGGFIRRELGSYRSTCYPAWF